MKFQFQFLIFNFETPSGVEYILCLFLGVDAIVMLL